MTNPNTDEPNSMTELTTAQRGYWRVVTRDSLHLFDLEGGSVTRIRGATAIETVNDRTRPLRTIEKCEVGKRGHWTMHTDNYSFDIDYFWAHTSRVHRIEPLSQDEFEQLRRDEHATFQAVEPEHPEHLDGGESNAESEETIASYTTSTLEGDRSGEADAWDVVVGDGLEQENRRFDDPTGSGK